MTTLRRAEWIIVAALLIGTGSAFGQQPPDPVNSDAFGNTAVGTGALFGDTPSLVSGVYFGSYSTATGAGAGYAHTTGSYNTATGASALSANTTGNYNTANGVNALMLNTTGSSNTALGQQTLTA